MMRLLYSLFLNFLNNICHRIEKYEIKSNIRLKKCEIKAIFIR